ncbi:long-chain-fatty-acid--CoA ligase [Ramlibacter albus]|uniref:AMP-binding protein n=1 Tax=Ramlibacter albus TaxID=2079448 RepID=A0A923M8S9_9BURK|nr:long-chain-fatty-acid--CoA ligase [Ramlibacter albus]MBC5765781.1 AMP-binding protein [Ramlibacter albus]
MADRPHFRFWPKGVARDLVVPHATLPEFLDTSARRYPGKPAFVFEGGIVTYAQLKQRVDALAAYLQQRLGIGPGDRVLLMSQNCPQYVAACYAVLRVGGVVVPVNPMCKQAEVGYYAADSGATAAFVAHELLGAIPFGDEPGKIAAAVVFDYAGTLPQLADDRLHPMEAAIAKRLQFDPEKTSPDDIAVLPYTSGTTGHPKGCIHTHATVVASLAASAVWKGLHAESVMLCVAPLFHMLGMQNGMNLPIMLGATAVMMPRWNAQLAAQLIEQHRVTAWTAPPAMIIDLFTNPEAQARDLSSLALLSGGAAAMPEAVATMLTERYGIIYNEGYGLTETASFLQANPLGRGKRQCLGIPSQGVDMRVIDPQTLAELPQGETGELVAHGKQITLGYWNNPAATREAFLEIDGKRFFRTGDLGYMDEEGYFFIRDRLKRMINASGYKVWPNEVENAMYDHPAVHEACVIGVPDGKRGETVKALVVCKPGMRSEYTEQQVIDWCRERMAVYKAPRIVEFVEKLPKSGTGKILWRELQEQHRASSMKEAA